MGEMPEECKNSIRYKEGDKQKVENYRRISLLKACYKLHIKFLNEKFKTGAEKFPLECQTWF